MRPLRGALQGREMRAVAAAGLPFVHAERTLTEAAIVRNGRAFGLPEIREALETRCATCTT
jgi:hypothetical protein